jgi:hypothetical protein
MRLEPGLRNEVTPKNILMIGPTGVGKTEIARRLAQLANAPFVKVEATKFTEVGYVGKDVDSIARDLADAAFKMLRDQAKAKVRAEAEQRAEERVLDALLPRPAHAQRVWGEDQPPSPEHSETREKFRRQLREGKLDEREVEFDLTVNSGVDIMAPPGMEEMQQQLKQMFSSLAGQKSQKRKLAIKVALPAAHRGGGRQAGERGGAPASRAGPGRAERHRVHRRDRQGLPALRLGRRRREPRGRAARPVAAGRGQHRQHQVRASSRPTTCCSSPRARSAWPSRPT